MTNQGTVFQINISKGGVPKLPIEEAEVSTQGIIGDKQKDRRYHGGPEHAVCLFSIELIEELQKEGHPISAGSTGENITLSTSQFDELFPSVQLQIGNDVLIEITSYAAPCKTIRSSFVNEEFIRISHKIHPNQSRLYAKVLREGRIKKGDLIRILQ